MRIPFRKSRPCKVEYHHRPGRSMSRQTLSSLHDDLVQVAGDCFTQVPAYQCLTGKREEFTRTVITVARNRQGEALGFCSAVILEVDGYKNILHLGLTCVKKKARGLRLTHKLTSRLLLSYLVRTSKFKRIWFTNVACVLSSLGNVALYFEQVYPSPLGLTEPGKDHVTIARALDEKFRNPVAINNDAVLDMEHFVFRGSVSQTVFQKSARDSRYFHRDPGLTDFYLNRLDFKNGDEVIQVGRVGLLSFPKYLVKNTAMMMLKATQSPIERLKTAKFLGK